MGVRYFMHSMTSVLSVAIFVHPEDSIQDEKALSS
jgi:hypothetical protein